MRPRAMTRARDNTSRPPQAAETGPAEPGRSTTMRAFLSSQWVSGGEESARADRETEEELVADARGALSPAHWVEQKFQALMRNNSPARKSPLSAPGRGASGARPAGTRVQDEPALRADLL